LYKDKKTNKQKQNDGSQINVIIMYKSEKKENKTDM